MDEPVTIRRERWTDLMGAFRTFFDGLGDVDADDAHVRFDAADTSFELDADGTSTSFMPLHTASLRWERVTFDPTEQSVSLTDGTSTYVYRVPPHLVRARDRRRGRA